MNLISAVFLPRLGKRRRGAPKPGGKGKGRRAAARRGPSFHTCPPPPLRCFTRKGISPSVASRRGRAGVCGGRACTGTGGGTNIDSATGITPSRITETRGNLATKDSKESTIYDERSATCLTKGRYEDEEAAH